jgi:hypothetical protein
MPNTLKNAWVKNVYKLRMYVGKTGDLLSPIVAPRPISPTSLVDNYPLVHQTIPDFTQQLYTLIFRFLPLLNSSYTHNPHPLLLEPIVKN